MAYIHHLETLVPAPCYSQSFACEVMMERSGSDRAKRYIKKVYSESGIEHRHSVLTDFLDDSTSPRLFRQPDDSFREPSTGERNAIYVEEARRLIPEIVRNAVDNSPGISARKITHVITISCTGFFNPGPDLLVVDALDLAPSVQRYHLGFMGCYAAFPGLKMAEQFCRADPAAVVLLLCVEFCSIHLQSKDDLDSIVANSVFADGAAAALISASPPSPGTRGYSLSRFASRLAREGLGDMAWDIGDQGFNIVLSKYVARIIGASIKDIVDDVLDGSGMAIEDIHKWAIHPGGRAILDKIEASLALRPDQIAASRTTLARYGNMSSSTVLFVLAEILRDKEIQSGQSVCAMAFGPGLTIETAILNAVVS